MSKKICGWGDSILEMERGVPGKDLSPIKLLRELTGIGSTVDDYQMVIMINEELLLARQELRILKGLPYFQISPRDSNEK